MNRPPRNAIDSQRRVAARPFDPSAHPDIQRPVQITPGFPPDTDGFCVSTFTGRFALMGDLFYLAPWNEGLLVNETTPFSHEPITPGGAFAGFIAPPGFRIIVEHIFIPALIEINPTQGDANNTVPYLNAGGVMDPSFFEPTTLIGVYKDSAPVPDQFFQDTVTGTAFNFIYQLLYAPLSIDTYIRVESGSILTLETYANPASGVGINRFTYNIPFIEFRGQIEAVENRELTTLGMSVDPVPTSEKRGLILDQKRIER